MKISERVVAPELMKWPFTPCVVCGGPNRFTDGYCPACYTEYHRQQFIKLNPELAHEWPPGGTS